MYSTINKQIRELCRENDNGWTYQTVGTVGRVVLEKDGYKIYFFKDGCFDLSIRNPRTTEREKVFSCCSEDIATGSPLYLAFIEYVMENAETITAMEMDNDNSQINRN